MFVPGHQARKVEKALGLELDVAILDLEDGVPPGEKERARERVAETLGAPRGGPQRFVRVHPVGSDVLERDLDAALRPGCDGLVLPKVEQPEEVLQIDTLLEEREARAGLPPGSVRLVALIESARGLIQAPAIAAASLRLLALMFGAEDYMRDLGMLAVGTAAAGDLLYARSAVVVAAAAARLQAIDRVYLDVRDADGLHRDTLQARGLGFTGKALIHPDQIAPVHRAFAPTDAEREFARRVLAAFAAAEAAGEGAVLVDGQMVDLPVVERARHLLAAKPSHG
jgi:citrate lyase beta subunit